MKKFIQKIRKVLHAVLDAWICRGRFCTITVAELPDSLQQRRFYVIGNAVPWSAAFLCPCGCDEVIHISLLPNDLPSWSVSFNRSSLPTLSPSVRRTKRMPLALFSTGRFDCVVPVRRRRVWEGYGRDAH